MKCPNCLEESFITKKYESVEIDLCKKCQGIWLDNGELKLIVENRVTEFSQKQINDTISYSFAGVPKKERDKKRPFPKCRHTLKAINYAVDSGIIIDICPQEHGIWFDHFELEKVQEFRDYWNDKVYDNQKALFKLLDDQTPSNDSEISNSLLFNIAGFIGDKIFKS